MIEGGLKTHLVTVDLKAMPKSFAGRKFDESLLDSLPADVDPCGERGEFHTCVLDGPMFSRAIAASVGEVVEREGFAFADLVPVG
jgi:diphthamide synthase (EF-2-diphthine--ammonia ligase)